jgi:septal ring factor EnvC (AmiA/AmiB activator)
MYFRTLSLAAGIACAQPGCAAATSDCNAEQMREIARDLDRAEQALAGVRQEVEAVDARIMAAINDYEERRIEAAMIDRILTESEADNARLRVQQSDAEVRVARLMEAREACRHPRRSRPVDVDEAGRSGS